MTDLSRIETAHRAAEALKVLDDAFAAVAAVYMERITQVAGKEPWEARKITNLALAAKIAGEVRAMIHAAAEDGKVAEKALEHRRKIEAMSPERRKVLGLTIPGAV